jgi:membrane associated rhomboid family serine protease
MIPLGDNNDDRKLTPYVNYALIAANILVFVLFQQLGANANFILSYSTVPAEILSGTDVTENGLLATPIPVYGTLLTSMFMHGSIAHIGGNMLYLWVFGDNLENRMGHARYLAFYLICGLIASLSHVLLASVMGKDMFIPSLGASGAISGVLGGYLLLFPKNQVRVLAVAVVITVPAFVTLGLWIALQLFSGWGSLSDSEGGGGVAYAAHIGGFIAGLLLVRFFARSAQANLS